MNSDNSNMESSEYEYDHDIPPHIFEQDELLNSSQLELLNAEIVANQSNSKSSKFSLGQLSPKDTEEEMDNLEIHCSELYSDVMDETHVAETEYSPMVLTL